MLNQNINIEENYKEKRTKMNDKNWKKYNILLFGFEFKTKNKYIKNCMLRFCKLSKKQQNHQFLQN